MYGCFGVNMSCSHRRYEYTYGILSGSVLLISLFRSFLFFHIVLKAGTRMHNAMAHRCTAAVLLSCLCIAYLCNFPVAATIKQPASLPKVFAPSRTAVLCTQIATSPGLL